MSKHYPCLIIGAGPCGISTAIELKHLGISCAIIEGGAIGGKINIAPQVDNYPHQESISGPELAFKFYERALKEGVEIIGDTVTSLTKEGSRFNVLCQYGEYTSEATMIASGTKERKLGLEKEDFMLGRGLSYCAICDGHFFKGKNVLLVGGGNTALKEAIFLSRIVNKLYLVHRRNEFRGSTKLVEELKQKDNVEILTPFIPSKIIGDDYIEGIEIQNRETNETKVLSVDGFFPLVGQLPNTDFIHIENVLDEYKTIPVNKDKMSKCLGLFAGGDVLPRDIRQIYLAEYDGKIASKAIANFLEEK